MGEGGWSIPMEGSSRKIFLIRNGRQGGRDFGGRVWSKTGKI